jgi:septal ring factor EnvC (AmiA/AmiB activator)
VIRNQGDINSNSKTNYRILVKLFLFCDSPEETHGCYESVVVTVVFHLVFSELFELRNILSGQSIILSKLRSMMSQQRNSLSSLNNSLSRLRDSQSGLRSSLSGLRNRLSRLRKILSELRNRLSGLRKRLC